MGNVEVNINFGPHKVRYGSVIDLRYTLGRTTSPLHDYSPGIGLSDRAGLIQAAASGYSAWLDWLDTHYSSVRTWVMGQDVDVRAACHEITI